MSLSGYKKSPIRKNQPIPFFQDYEFYAGDTPWQMKLISIVINFLKWVFLNTVLGLQIKGLLRNESDLLPYFIKGYHWSNFQLHTLYKSSDLVPII